VVLQLFDSADDMRTGGQVFAAMDSAQTPGTRVSVDMCETKLERHLWHPVPPDGHRSGCSTGSGGVERAAAAPTSAVRALAPGGASLARWHRRTEGGCDREGDGVVRPQPTTMRSRPPALAS
jgi:hypothetical protein